MSSVQWRRLIGIKRQRLLRIGACCGDGALALIVVGIYMTLRHTFGLIG